MTAPLTMTIEEYARHRGCSAQAVRKLRKKHGLVEDALGRVLVATTDAHLRAVLDPARSPTVRRQIEASMGAGVPAPKGQGGEPVDSDSYAGAARLEKLERYRNLKLQNEELAGNLVKRDIVERMVFQLARQAQEGLTAIVDRIGSQLAVACPGLDVAKVYALLEAEHRRLAEQMVADARDVVAKAASGEQANQRVAA